MSLQQIALENIHIAAKINFINYAVKDLEMVPGRRAGICLCVNAVPGGM